MRLTTRRLPGACHRESVTGQRDELDTAANSLCLGAVDVLPSFRFPGNSGPAGFFLAYFPP